MLRFFQSIIIFLSSKMQEDKNIKLYLSKGQNSALYAQVKDYKYRKELTSDIDIEEFEKILGHWKFIEMTPQILKIKVGIYNIQLENIDKQLGLIEMQQDKNIKLYISKGQKSVLFAQVEDFRYRKELKEDFDIEGLQNILGHFQIINRTPQILKIKVGINNIQLENIDKQLGLIDKMQVDPDKKVQQLYEQYHSKYGHQLDKILNIISELNNKIKKIPSKCQNSVGVTGTYLSWGGKATFVCNRMSKNVLHTMISVSQNVKWLETVIEGFKKTIFSNSTWLAASVIAVFQIGNLLYKFAKGQISGEQFWKFLAIKIASVAVSSTAAYTVIAALTPLFGSDGIVWGSIVAAAAGGIAAYYSEKKLEEWWIRSLKFVEKKEKLSLQYIYGQSLKLFDLTRSANKNEIKKEIRNRLLRTHPDKVKATDQEQKKQWTQKFLNYMSAAQIIRQYHKEVIGTQI